jgi:hypothetical protein
MGTDRFTRDETSDFFAKFAEAAKLNVSHVWARERVKDNGLPHSEPRVYAVLGLLKKAAGRRGSGSQGGACPTAGRPARGFAP